ncbi:hypothetical protein V6N11_077403 [Hibiscus sabdariffa]|uniref:RNase H type-1 domain-containing protein n=1 Tax=Hibiscus sabdariffa TaxID=183260 RepID=A0ABR2TDE6_9ROSI
MVAFSTSSSGMSARQSNDFRWQCPPVGWIKVNSDGAMYPASEIDNQEVARILCRDFDALAGHALVDSLHGLLSRQWLIRIPHISSEINGVADGLAVMSRDVLFAVLEFPSVPTELVDFVDSEVLLGYGSLLIYVLAKKKSNDHHMFIN